MDNTFETENSINERNTPTRSRKQPKSNSFFSALTSYGKKGKIDLPFFILVMVLLTIGLVMMFSASFVSALYQTSSHDSLFYIKRQFVFAVAGVIAMLIISRIDYKLVRKFSLLLFIITLALLILVRLLPSDDGVYRWIHLGPLSLQPSEIAKFTIIAVLAHLIALHPEKMNNVKYVLILCVIIGLFSGLLMLEKHLSGTILIAAIGVCMLYAGGVFNKHKMVFPIIMIVGIVGVIAVILLIKKFPSINAHAYVRVEAWLDKDYDPMGYRWQTNNSLYAIGSGGLLGSGLGQSMQKYLYVSQPQNDFVFAIVCEELGFVGAGIIIVLFCILIYRGVLISTRSKDTYASLLTMGIVFQVGIQVILNIAVVTDTIPNTGISLPFFSYGGTSLLMLLMEMGVVLSVSRTAKIEKN